MSEDYYLLAAGINVSRTPKKLPSHRADIEAMRAGGFVVNDEVSRIVAHVCGFKLLGRGEYDTVSPGTHPEEPNCLAYPTPDGGWSIHRFGTSAEHERPGWVNNSHGYASFKLPGPKPTINLSRATDQEIADTTTQALTLDPNIYQRGNLLCEVRPGSPLPPHVLRKPDSPIIVPLSKSAVRLAIATNVDFRKEALDKLTEERVLVRAQQPSWLAENIYLRGRYTVPVIETISSTPLFLPNGKILTSPGYDTNTGILYRPDEKHLPDLMSKEDAIEAIGDVIGDFPFAKLAHKSAAYAGILSLLARPAILGRTPLFLIEGNRPGCGKGLLADVIGIIGSGGAFARMTAPEGEDEWRKRLTSIFMAGEPAILLDNLSGQLKSATLDAALTSETWSDRLLGRNETVNVPMATVFFGTGNNLFLHNDTCRRTCHIRLETTLERPETRDDCKHKDLLAVVRSKQARLTMAGLSLLHHFHVARRPDQGLKPWGSFEGWSLLIRNCIVWAGMPDPMETMTDLQAANDEDSPQLRLLLDGWEEVGRELTATEAVNLSHKADGGKATYPALHEAMETISGNDKPKTLGITLRKYLGCRLGGRYFERVKGKNTKWVVKAA